VASLLLSRLTPLVAPVRERRPETAQAGGVFFKILMASSDSITDTAQSTLRRAAKNARAGLSVEQRRQASEKIASKIIASDLFDGAQNIACYIPLDTEVSTWPIIRRAWDMKKRVFAPVTKKNFQMVFCEFTDTGGLEANKWGLQEPKAGKRANLKQLDVVIAPVVAFDMNRNRIGMGGGFYDRAFSFLGDADDTIKPVLIGVAFDCQNVEKISPNPWDIRLFRIITESTDV